MANMSLKDTAAALAVIQPILPTGLTARAITVDFDGGMEVGIFRGESPIAGRLFGERSYPEAVGQPLTRENLEAFAKSVAA